jgi:hypothetical protein
VIVLDRLDDGLGMGAAAVVDADDAAVGLGDLVAARAEQGAQRSGQR